MGNKLRRVLIVMLVMISPALAAVQEAGAEPVRPGFAQAMSQDEGKDDDGNRGHGNDEDGVDEDNPGQGRDKEKDEPSGKAAPVEVTASYRVETECKDKEENDRNLVECEFRGVAPKDAEKIRRVIVPQDAVCADVLGGQFEQVEVHTGEGLNGYASEDGQDKLRLQLAPDVNVAGTTTFWIVTDSGLYPAEGPGLDCGEGETMISDESAVSTPTPETGSLTVVLSTCADAPDDTAGFDWFGACQPGGETEEYRVYLANGDASGATTASTDADGEAVFADLLPGEYTLEAMDGPWCHAKSDRVNAESNVIIEAGEQTTVYVFSCDDETGGS